ncbi:hypothetical protein HQ489_05065 [Candidatus Woesearchaeota archaeon]|nr:hypothetical protein [Candidatus Woesearchaeota archaeon]
MPIMYGIAMGSVYQSNSTSEFSSEMNLPLYMQKTFYNDLSKGSEVEEVKRYTPIDTKMDLYLPLSNSISPYQNQSMGVDDLVMGQPFQFEMYGKPERSHMKYAPLEMQGEVPFEMMVPYEMPTMPIYTSGKINLPLPIFDRQKKDNKTHTIDATVAQPKTMKDLFKGSLATLIAKELGELETPETLALEHHHEEPMYLDGLMQPQLLYN